MIVPLSTERFIRWLSRELGSPPVRGPPVLVPVPEVDAGEVSRIASLGLPAIVTSPNAVDMLESMLPRSVLAAALSKSIAIGPMTADAILSAVPGASVSVPGEHNSRSLASSLADARYVLWCSEGVDRSLVDAVERRQGLVVRLYRLDIDERAIDELRRSLSDEDLVVFASGASVSAWRLLRKGIAANPRAVAVSRRIAGALASDAPPSLAIFEDGDMRKFPHFLRAVYGG
ncbi:MAG: uroporphyrinogen-III synthase [Conexivisphaerales archaeon]|nr:uroporphyrinogen-III synthase [Conexivisphaerales archaeon]